MFFSKVKEKIAEAQRRARNMISEILPLLDRLPVEKIDDVEDFLDANIADARRQVKKFGGNNGWAPTTSEKEEKENRS